MKSTISKKTTANLIPLSKPVISGNEWKYIKECLDTEWVSSVGNYVGRFEEMVAEYVGAKYAVAMVNGTAALHLSLIACDVQPGDEVIVPSLTFIAPVNTVRYCRAEPIFMDCDPETLCLDVSKLFDFLKNNTIEKDDHYTYNKNSGRRIKAIIPVHIFGHPVDMDSLIDICQADNIEVIEDATESLGSQYKGKKTGSLGKIGCFSFNGNKIITTGGGGMVVTDDQALARRIRHLGTQAKYDPIEYYHDEIGYNYRLSNIQAAMGVAQMERLDEYIAIKRANFNLYKELIDAVKGYSLLEEKKWVRSNYWFYSLLLLNEKKNELIKKMASQGIQVRPIWRLIHALPMYKDCEAFQIEQAFKMHDRILNLPCSVDLKREDIRIVCDLLRQYRQAGG